MTLQAMESHKEAIQNADIWTEAYGATLAVKRMLISWESIF